MFKNVTCGVALLIGFVACGAGSEEASEDLAAPSVIGEEASNDESPAASSNAALSGDQESVGGEDKSAEDTSAEVQASGLVCTACYSSLPPCFEDRDAIFDETGVVCVCQPPDLDQCCGSNQFDLECNL